jgi:hypothetical protein
MRDRIGPNFPEFHIQYLSAYSTTKAHTIDAFIADKRKL